MNFSKTMLGLGAAGLLFTLNSTAYALGLGTLDLQSRLNQQFSAHIPVFVPDETEPSEVSVRLAPDSAFERAGIRRSGLASQLKFTAQRTSEGNMVIMVRSPDRIIEPMISFVIEVEQGGIKTIRKYTAMLETPH